MKRIAKGEYLFDNSLSNTPIPTECCYPECHAEITDRAKEPLCDDHLVRIFRSVVSIGRDFDQEKMSLKPQIIKTPKPVDPYSKYLTLGVVYFIRLGDRIKIGFTTDLEGRMRVVPHEEVLATMPGSMKTERAIHRKFSRTRVIGEWFLMSDELMQYIESIKQAA